MDAVFYQFVPQGMKSALKGSIEPAKPPAKVAAAAAVTVEQALPAPITVDPEFAADLQALMARVERLETHLSSLSEQVQQLMLNDMPPLTMQDNMQDNMQDIIDDAVGPDVTLDALGAADNQSVTAPTEIDTDDGAPVVIVQNVALRSVEDVHIINLDACTLSDLHAVVQYLYDQDKDTSNLLGRSKKMKRVKLIAGIKALLA